LLTRVSTNYGPLTDLNDECIGDLSTASQVFGHNCGAAMKNLFCLLPSSGQQTVLSFYVTIRLSTAHKMTLGLIALWSLLMVISALRPPQGKDPGMQRRGIVGVAGVLGLLSVLGSLYWYTYDLYSHSYWGMFSPSLVANTFWVARRVLAGATIAMFVFVIFPKGAKVVLVISVTVLFASELFSISHNGNWGLAPPLLTLISAWSIGMAIPSAIVFYLGQDKNKR
jgi:hypothetical protein